MATTEPELSATGLLDELRKLVVCRAQKPSPFIAALHPAIQHVAATDLLPEVNREPGWRTALLVFVGVASLLILKYLLHV
jgi:hypothetical protein